MAGIVAENQRLAEFRQPLLQLGNVPVIEPVIEPVAFDATPVAPPEPITPPVPVAHPEHVAPPEPVAPPGHVASPEPVAPPGHVTPPEPVAPIEALRRRRK